MLGSPYWSVQALGNVRMSDEQQQKLLSGRWKVMLSYGFMRDSKVTVLHSGSWCGMKADAADRYMMRWLVFEAAAADNGGTGQLMVIATLIICLAAKSLHTLTVSHESRTMIHSRFLEE